MDKKKDIWDYLLNTLMILGTLFLVIYTIPNMVKDWDWEPIYTVECKKSNIIINITEQQAKNITFLENVCNEVLKIGN